MKYAKYILLLIAAVLLYKFIRKRILTEPAAVISPLSINSPAVYLEPAKPAAVTLTTFENKPAAVPVISPLNVASPILNSVENLSAPVTKDIPYEVKQAVNDTWNDVPESLNAFPPFLYRKQTLPKY